MSLKTEIAAEVGKHAFEVAGLGISPFRFIGASENFISHPDGTTQAAGTCDYCGTGIRLECKCVSADGKTFVVGCNCIAKVGDSGLLKAYKQSPAFRAHQRELAYKRAQIVRTALESLINENAVELSARPHPYGFSDRQTDVALTALDYWQYQFNACGAAGRWLAECKDVSGEGCPTLEESIAKMRSAIKSPEELAAEKREQAAKLLAEADAISPVPSAGVIIGAGVIKSPSFEGSARG